MQNNKRIYHKMSKRSNYYLKEIENYINFLIPPHSSVLMLGCGCGEILGSLKPSRGLGIDCEIKNIDAARKSFPSLEFQAGINELKNIHEKFDYILIYDIPNDIDSLKKTLKILESCSLSDSRIIIIHDKKKTCPECNAKNKVSTLKWSAIKGAISQESIEPIKEAHRTLICKYIPLISVLFNKIIINLPIFWRFSLINILVAKPTKTRKPQKDVSCSVIIPCRNEKGNIEPAIKRTPKMGSHTEFIFIEGHSQDGTLEECYRVQKAYPEKDIKVFVQDNVGKRDAVYKGFANAKGDIYIILDADLTVLPEDLSKFFNAIASGKGEFINGSRLVLKMEKEAMRKLNWLANKFFGFMFSYLLSQKLTDTLCGTKVLWKDDFQRIVAGRCYFGNFDPFGDFDLILGSAKLNLKFVEIPIRYQARKYGSTQISRFRHGLLLLKMTIFAMRKIKFI